MEPSPYQPVTFENKNYFLQKKIIMAGIYCNPALNIFCITSFLILSLVQFSPAANSIANLDKYMDFEESLWYAAFSIQS